MRLLQNRYFDLFEACFIRYDWDSPTVAPSLMCCPPNSKAENNYQSVVVWIVRITISTTIKSLFVGVYL